MWGVNKHSTFIDLYHLIFSLDASVGDSVDDAEAEVLIFELQRDVENWNHSRIHLCHYSDMQLQLL